MTDTISNADPSLPGDAPLPLAARTLTPSLLTSLFVIFTGVALVTLVSLLYTYARQVVTTPFQRGALVAVTILLGLLGLAGVVVAVVDIVWRFNGHYRQAEGEQAATPGEP